MNRSFKRKLVFVKVCSLFSFIRFTNAEKIKKKKTQESILSPRFTSPVQSAKYSMPILKAGPFLITIGPGERDHRCVVVYFA